MIKIEYLYICVGLCASIVVYWFVTSIQLSKKYKMLERGLSAYVKKFGEHTFLFNDETGEVHIEGKEDKK